MLEWPNGTGLPTGWRAGTQEAPFPMAERVFIGVAWPYPNGPLHIGHIAGCYLPADIFARYHRLAGNDVLMVSGSDQHGTPITVLAEREGMAPAAIAGRYHASFLESWEQLGISFDLYTSTGTENHARTAQEIFLRLLEHDFIYTATTTLPFCENDKRFLPDRYINGTCPHCGFSDARGDECDSCGRPLDPFELRDPRCQFCGSAPVGRESEHFFLRLSAFADELYAWAKEQRHWRPSVYNFTLRYLEDGLRDRAITRDIEWGLPIPVPGYENKRLYIWFENIIGYLSASKEWAQRQGQPERWRGFWEGGQARSYYFIGKDNLFFHTLQWPAELMGFGGLNLPYDVPANEFLNLEGRPLSTSRGWAVWVPEYLSRFQPDPLRYYLSAIMPEAADTDFSWEEFVRRNNDELVATYGNLAHRLLTFTYRNFEGAVPLYGAFGPEEETLIERCRATLDAVGHSLSRCRFREALRAAMELAHEGNRYLDTKAPWRTIRTDRAATAITLGAGLSAVNALKVALAPFLPFSSDRLQTLLGFSRPLAPGDWRFEPIPPGQRLPEPQPLFAKLDDAIVEEERQRLGQIASPS